MNERMIDQPVHKELWDIGPNYAADSVVLADDSVLLIRRRDTGLWALPGGFVDQDETALSAAKREVLEETGLDIQSDGIEVYSGPVDDPRNTTERWIESTVYLYVESTCQSVDGHDDAFDAGWFSLDDLPSQLHGSHAIILQLALERLSLLT